MSKSKSVLNAANPTSLKTRLFSASVLSLADQFLKVASALIISPVIIHGLGVENYGTWILAVSIAGYCELMDLGFSLAAVRYYSRAIGANDVTVLSGLFQYLRRHYRRLGGVLVLLGAGFAGFELVTTQQMAAPSVWMIVAVLAISNGVSFWLRPHATLLKARLEYGKIIGTGIVRLLLFTVIIWVWRSQGFSLWTILGLQGSLQVLEQLTLYAWARRLVPKFAVSASLSREDRSGFLRFAGQVAVGGLTTVLRQRVDTQLLGWYSTLASISHYSIGSRLPLLFFDFLSSIFGGHLMAGFSQLAARGDTANLHNTLFRMLRFSAFAAAMGGCGIYVFGPTFVEVWLGPHFVASYPVLRMLTLGMIATAMHFPVFPFLGAINAYGIAVRISLITSAMNFLCSLILVQRLGLIGVVWGTLIEQLVWGLILWPMIVAREASIPFWDYIQIVFVKAMIPFVAVGLALMWSLKVFGQPNSYFDLAVCGGAAIAFLAPFSWFVLLSVDERSAVRKQISNWTGRL